MTAKKHPLLSEIFMLLMQLILFIFIIFEIVSILAVELKLKLEKPFV